MKSCDITRRSSDRNRLNYSRSNSKLYNIKVQIRERYGKYSGRSDSLFYILYVLSSTMCSWAHQEYCSILRFVVWPNFSVVFLTVYATNSYDSCASYFSLTFTYSLISNTTLYLERLHLKCYICRICHIHISFNTINWKSLWPTIIHKRCMPSLYLV